MTEVVSHFLLISGTWKSFGRPDRGTVPAPAPGFVLGTTKPVDENTGAGIIRPLNQTVVTGNVIVNDGEVYADRIIDGHVTLNGTGRIENCLVRGSATAPTASGFLIRTSTTTTTVTNVPNISYCTVEPRTPSAYWSGIGSKNYYAYRTKVIGCTDAFGAFSQTTDGLANVRIGGCFVPDLTQFRPDYANSNRAETHNDCMQMQGNLGGADDILMEGNNFIARHHPTYGTQPTTYTQLAALMVSPNTQASVSYTSRMNWYGGGVFTINAGSANTGGTIIHDGDRFEPIGKTTPGPDKLIVIDSTATWFVTNCIDENGNAAVRVSG